MARLHPEVVAFQDECARAGLGDLRAHTLEGARDASRRSLELASAPLAVHVPRCDVVMSTGGREIPARVYRGDSPSAGGPGAAALVWFHGGGFVLGDLDAADQICSRLALQAQVVVVSVDYRLAPEHPWPAAHDDAYDAVLWVLDHGAEIGIDPSRVAVGGDSAGGHLAATTARRVAAERGARLRLQLLFYPVTSADTDTASYRDYATGFGLDAVEMRWFLDLLDVREGFSTWPFALDATDPPPGLAPAHVITAECDILRDGAEAHLAALVQAGVGGTCVRFLGMPHGFAQMTAVTPQADAAIASAAHALSTALASEAPHPRDGVSST